VCLPRWRDWGDILRWLSRENVPGAYPYTAGVFPFKRTEEFGYHFSGDSSGPAIAWALQESFGSSYFVFETGPKFEWDIPIVDGIGLYLSPGMLVGFAVAEGNAGVTIQPSFRGKLILGDRGMVFFQPFLLDIMAGSEVIVRYDLMFGGGVTF